MSCINFSLNNLVDFKCFVWCSKIRRKKIWFLTNLMKCLKRNLF